MPSFDQLILSAPAGFVNSCLSLNALVENEDLSKLVQEAWKEVLKMSVDEPFLRQYAAERKSLVFIIRSMKSAQPAPSISNAAKILIANSILTQETIEKILLQIKELSKSGEFQEDKTFKSSGKMSNFQWKIGVALASDNCKNLFDPYVAVRFDVTTQDGHVVPHTAELTYEQFKELKATVEKAGRAMDSI